MSEYVLPPVCYFHAFVLQQVQPFLAWQPFFFQVGVCSYK
jgi:hypothetical protein